MKQAFLIPIVSSLLLILIGLMLLPIEYPS